MLLDTALQPLIFLHAVTCPRPQNVRLDNVGDRNPALVGTVATSSCPPGMVLTGPNVTNLYGE